MGSIRLLTLILSAFVIQGCATLSKSECRKADWEIIGLEDGSQGRPVTYIGRHRKSCAEYGVKPELARYQQGHSKGTTIFCTPKKGFELGNSGRSHNDICPAELRGAFLAAFGKGQELNLARKAVNEAKLELEDTRTEYDEVAQEIVDNEAKLVSGNGTVEQRKTWLNRIKELQSEQGRLQDEIHHLEHEYDQIQGEYDYLSSRYQY